MSYRSVATVAIMALLALPCAFGDDNKKKEEHAAKPAPPAQQQHQAAPQVQHQQQTPPQVQSQRPQRPVDRPANTNPPGGGGSNLGNRNERRVDRPANTIPQDHNMSRPADRPMNSTSRPLDHAAPPVIQHGNSNAGPAPHNNVPMDRQMNNRPSNAMGRPEVRNEAPRMGVSRSNDGRVQSYRSPAGHEVHYAPNGQVREVHMAGRTVIHGAGGSGRIIYTRPDRTVIVTNRSGHGYVQRPFAYHGVEYVHRTYYVHGMVRSNYYRPYTWGGATFYSYTPVRYYPPAFYGWAYRPWDRPVSYRWGWAGSPWYGYYGGYFAPSPYYVSPSLWLVDYIIAARLAEAYSDRGAGQQQAYYGSGGITPEMKQQISMEVQRQIELEQRQASDPSGAGNMQSMFNDGQSHLFIVSYNIDVVDQRNQECTVTRGDVLRLSQPPAPGAQAAYVEVVASTGSSCRAGSMVAVSLQDLQDTQNQMRESINAGMGELQQNGGRNGLPVLPVSARAAAMPASFAEVAPQADAQVAQELQQEVRETDQMEQQVINEARGAEQAPAVSTMPPMEPRQQQPAGPTRIVKGQTINEVMAVLGSPQHIVEVGKKQVYVYPDLKITFNNGRVSDVQ